MAKQGTITAPTGSDATLKTLGDSTPVRNTLMGVVRDALSLTSALKLVLINFFVRKVVIVPSGTNVTSCYTDLIGGGQFEKDDPTKASSPWTYTPGGDLTAVDDKLAAIVAERKPSMSVESLVNAIEDAYDELVENEDIVGGIVQFDQALGQINPMVAESSPTLLTNSHTAAVALTEDVQYVQTLDSGAAQFAE